MGDVRDSINTVSSKTESVSFKFGVTAGTDLHADMKDVGINTMTVRKETNRTYCAYSCVPRNA